MIAITFDTDWMQPDDLGRFLEEFPFPGSGTFFMHRAYKLPGLEAHELCPHPFPVMPGEWKSSIAQLLEEYRLAPTGIRTHSTIHSHILELALFELGFKYTSNSSRLFLSGTRPVRLAWGCWEMPVYYMDNLDLTMAKFWPKLGHQPLAPDVLNRALADEDGLYVFDFHPLHVCLNTPTLEYYLGYQAQLKAGASPFKFRFAGEGVGTFFRKFCELMAVRGTRSVPLIQALEAMTGEMLCSDGHGQAPPPHATSQAAA